jgi:uncharacterized protein (TIGR00730 family)
LIKNACVFASSSNNLDSTFYKDAKELGSLLGSNGINIVYGGSRLGMMYACASKVKEFGGRIIGVMPQKLYDMGCGNPEDCDEFYLTSGMRERKAKMDEISDAVIALAGGFGTLEEISEMIVQKQLGYNSKPIIIMNTKGYYNNLIRFFETIIAEKFAKCGTENLYFLANTPNEAINYLKLYDKNRLQYSGKF